MGRVTIFLIVLITIKFSAQDDNIYPWEDDYTSQGTTTQQPVLTGVDSTNIYPWEDDFTSQEITSQSPQGTIPEINSTNLYPWEDAVTSVTSNLPSTTSPTWIPIVTSGVYPWEDDYVSGGSQPQSTINPNTNNPTTTFWAVEPTSRPSWTTTTRKTTIGGLFQNPIFLTTASPHHNDPCRGLGIIRQLLCLARNLNPSIGISIGTGFGKK